MYKSKYILGIKGLLAQFVEGSLGGLDRNDANINDDAVLP